MKILNLQIPPCALNVYLKNRTDTVIYESKNRTFLFNERMEMCQLIEVNSQGKKTILHFEDCDATQTIKDFEFNLEWFGPRTDCAVDRIFEMNSKLFGGKRCK
ncbi:hypothetical protein [Burkholderia vietnamiensis]|uniref:hypothetical protein n=1 Tax=Burkholderia vietnamiensis TaxID=60552 RepID=UPI00159452C6|nr:hypothetical protein [Burkholderia vietnamiensis]